MVDYAGMHSRVGWATAASWDVRRGRYYGASMPIQRREGHMRSWIVSGAACCALAAQQTAGPVTVDLHADVLTRLSALLPRLLVRSVGRDACMCG